MSIAAYELAAAERERLLDQTISADDAILAAIDAALDALDADEVAALHAIAARPLGSLVEIAGAAAILRNLVEGGNWEDHYGPLAGRIAADLAGLAAEARGAQNIGCA